MASVEICLRKRNLKSSCDDIIGTVEDTGAIIIMKICGMYDIFGRRIILQETSMYMPHIYQNRSRARRHEYLSLHTARFHAIICVDLVITLQ